MRQDRSDATECSNRQQETETTNRTIVLRQYADNPQISVSSPAAWNEQTGSVDIRRRGKKRACTAPKNTDARSSVNEQLLPDVVVMLVFVKQRMSETEPNAVLIAGLELTPDSVARNYLTNVRRPSTT